MVIKDLKCVFIHIPKTAGTSIERVLCPPVKYSSTAGNRPNHGWHVTKNGTFTISSVVDTNLFGGWNEEHKFWMQHATMQQINDLYEESVSEYFKFTFIRNPYERAVSDWMFLRGERGDPNKNIQSKTFLKYLNRTGHFKEMLTTRNDKRTRIDHTYPQCDFIYDKNGNCLVDFIGRFENLQADFNTICDKIGIPRQKLPHEKKRNYKHYTEYYDEETKQIVAQLYARDIELFGYIF